MGGNRLKIIEKISNITPGIQKVFTQTYNITIKKLNDEDRKLIVNNLESLDFENYKTMRDKSNLGRYKKSITNFKKGNLEGQGVKIIIPSNIIDIYTRLEISLGLKLSSLTNTLREASNLIDELYKRGEIQNKQQYRNAHSKFQTYKMELLSKLLEEISFITRPKKEEHLLIVLNRSTHEE